MQAKDNETSAPQIEGTWSIIVTPAAGGPPAYLAIASFADGGVLLTSRLPFSLAPILSDGVRLVKVSSPRLALGNERELPSLHPMW